MIETSLDVSEIDEAIHVVHDRLSENVSMAMGLVSNLIASQAKEHHDYNDHTGVATNSIMSDGVHGDLFAGSLETGIGIGAAYGGPLEFGSKPHDIKPVHRKALAWPVEGGFMFAKVVHHPGNEEFAPLGNALIEKFAEAAEIIGDAVDLSFAEAGLE